MPFEGKSLVPAFSDKKIGRDFLFWEHQGNRALRVGDWKLVARVKNGTKFTPEDENKWELYNLGTDPSETIDLAPKFPQRLKEMVAQWEAEALRTKAKPWPWGR
jgi:arylsulfatase